MSTKNLNSSNLQSYVYLDHAATTPTDPKVMDIIAQYSTQIYANPSSVHQNGLKARKVINDSREIIAQFVNIPKEWVIFTSSGTESDNLALQGFLHRNENQKSHFIISAIEHPAVYNTALQLQKKGYELTILPVNELGLISITDLEAAIQPNTALISIHYVNNEIGSIQPVKLIGEIAAKHDIIFHTDAVQAFGKIPIDMKSEKIDLLSFSGHKIYASKGIGGLCINPEKFFKRKQFTSNLILTPLMYGGSQEESLRPSTENVPGIAGLGKAVQIAASIMDENSLRLILLRDMMIRRVLEEIPDSALNGTHENRIYLNCNFRFKGINGFDLLMLLDGQGIACSTGSACSSHSQTPSRVLTSLGLSEPSASSSIRLTLGRSTTKDDILYTIEKMKFAVKQLRAIN